MGVATRVVQAMVVLGATAGALLLASRYWPASTLEKQARAALEAPRDWPGTNAWADLALLARQDLDADGRQAEVAAHVAAYTQWQAQRLERIAAQAGRTPEALDLPAAPVLRTAPRPPLPDGLDACGQGRPAACLDQVRARQAEVAGWVAGHQWLYARLAGLARHGHLASPYPQPHAGMVIPDLGVSAYGRVAQALAHLQGDRTGAVDAVCRDLRTARMLAGHSDMLVGVMVGAQQLIDGGRWLATLLADWPPDEPLPASCTAVATPLDVEQTSLCAAFAGEHALGQAAVVESRAMMGQRWLAGWFLDVDKSGDRSAANLGRSCLAPARAAIAADEPVVLDPAEVPSPWHIRCLSNATGCILFSIATPVYRDYVLRMQDAAASQRLLGAWLWLREQPAGTDLAATLAQVPAAYRSQARPLRPSADGRALEVARYHDRQGEGALQLPLPAAWAPPTP